MPRITEERREARRREIVAAARRCFARDGFHQTSMPDIAREAGMSAGAFYRYFPSKDDVILEIAGQAFGVMAGRIEASGGGTGPPSVGDIVAAVVGPLGGDTITLPSGEVVPTDELARCGVQAWSELLRHESLRERAAAGFDAVRSRMAEVLRRGREGGAVPADLDPDDGARVVMALLPGFILQRQAFGLDDVAGFVRAVHTLLSRTPRSEQPV
ncbi:MAG TPA: TetR/AcrR family transcriptional regulator [Actinomycetospora sp.]|uniref:TetR/AcrR family transcriptional regulator n=1 Tax=Actinomycetospora sp. TaxID=1872135 RepID=UPI002F42AB45